MTLVVAVAPDGRGRALLHLAAMLARSTGEQIVLGAVVPSPWAPGPARVDAEYQAELASAAHAALEEARRRLPGDVSAAAVQVVHARSAPAGLLDLAAEHDAAALVLGSSSAGAFGHVALGSVSDRLLHSSPVPLALAPRGFRCRSGCGVRRVTAAYGGSAPELIAVAAREAARVGATLRVASFAVHPRAPIVAGVGQEADALIVAQWEREIRAAVPVGVETVVGHGETWDDALEDVEWEDGDVLVVGSSAIGPVARVFLGSRASKIIRHSPVPVVVVPREAID
jgi:nucleotide-binding universal stress UspA family protein